jgi:hypothetical protein
LNNALLTTFRCNSLLLQLRRRLVPFEPLLTESEKSFELTVLLKQPSLLLLQRVNVFGRLLKDGSLQLNNICFIWDIYFVKKARFSYK